MLPYIPDPESMTFLAVSCLTKPTRSLLPAAIHLNAPSYPAKGSLSIKQVPLHRLQSSSFTAWLASLIERIPENESEKGFYLILSTIHAHMKLKLFKGNQTELYIPGAQLLLKKSATDLYWLSVYVISFMYRRWPTGITHPTVFPTPVWHECLPFNCLKLNFVPFLTTARP